MSSENTSAIYAIRNSANQKLYVGSAVKLRKRWNEHRRALRNGTHHSVLLQRAFDKYGESAFLFEVLERVDDPSNLIPREQVWMERLGSCCPSGGYNVCKTAGSVLGFRHSDAAREKMSMARKGKPGPVFSDEQRSKFSAAKRGTKHSPEARRKMSISASQRVRAPMSEETKEKIRITNTGKKRSEETRMRIVEARRRRA